MNIDELNKFLSTDTRRKVFLYYVFSNISPSDIVSETKIPFSTVDRITQLLKAQDILIETSGKDLREKKYTINFSSWLEGNLKYLGLDFIEPEYSKQISELISDKIFFLLSYIFINPKFVIEFFQEPLEIGEDIPFIILMEMSEIQTKVAHLPSFILIYLKFSPLFKKLAQDINDNLLESDLKIINRNLKNLPFVKDILVGEEDLKNYEKKRTELILLMRRLFEKKILKMSVNKKEEE